MSSQQMLSEELSRSIAARVREELARRRITRAHLAAEARLSLSTLEKALSGRRPFTLATTVRVEEALGLSLRRREESAVPAALASGLAPDSLGSYARPAVGWIEGDYLTLRPSFGQQGAIYSYRTEIRWSDAASSLVFRESERADAEFTQDGSVSVPHQSGHIYLVTNKHGQYRLIVVARPTISGAMHGILTTLQAGRGSQLSPIATPLVLVPIEKAGTIHFGRIPQPHEAYGAYRRLLRRTIDDGFAALLTL